MHLKGEDGGALAVGGALLQGKLLIFSNDPNGVVLSESNVSKLRDHLTRLLGEENAPRATPPKCPSCGHQFSGSEMLFFPAVPYLVGTVICPSCAETLKVSLSHMRFYKILHDPVK